MKKKIIGSIVAVLILLFAVQTVLGMQGRKSERLVLADTLGDSPTSEYFEDLASARKVIKPHLDTTNIRGELTRYSWKQEAGGIYNFSEDGKLSQLQYGYQATTIGDITMKDDTAEISYRNNKAKDSYRLSAMTDQLILEKNDSQEVIRLFPLEKIEEDKN